MWSFRKLRGLSQFRRFMSKSMESRETENASGPISWKPRGQLEEAETSEGGTPTSFVRDFFIGNFETSALTYPEILEKERHEWLQSTIAPIDKFFSEKVDTQAIDSQAKIPDDVLKGLKVLGLFGQEIPVEYGGLGLNVTEHARVTEVTGLDTSIGLTLTSHQSFAIKGLLLFGTESQKKKYLPSLSSGQHIAAFCLTEPTSGSDMASMKTTATLSTDGKNWTISGSKIMITNGDSADIFLVFAKSADDTVSATSPRRITAFIVERKFDGVSNGETVDKHGVRGSTTCDVTFDKTPVPMENVIGEIGDGFKVASHILNNGRLSSACLASGLLKKMVTISTQQAIDREQFGKSICEYQTIREKLARMTLTAYVIESMIYLTAGIIDSKSFSDTSIETAILKVVSSEGCWQGASECLQIFGGQGYMKNSIMEVMLRDSRLFSIVEQTNEILRLFIGSVGIQYSGHHLRDVVKKIRNPLTFPGFALKKSIERMRQQKDTLKLTLRLREYLHPSLTESADLLESSVQRLKYVVALLLERYGAEVMNEQIHINRIADITIDLYSMTAVLSRASRSYCIGLRHASSEIALADVFCAEAAERIRLKSKQIDEGEYLLPDNPLMGIADTLLTNKGYFPEHPMTRNFW